MDQCEECQRLETPTRQPRPRLFSLALRSRSTTDNREPRPEKFEARARTGAAEQERVRPAKGGRRSGSNRASVRMRVLLDRQRPRNYGRLWACVPSRLPNGGAFALIRLFALPLHRPSTTATLWAVAPIAQETLYSAQPGPAQCAASPGFCEDSPNYSDTGKITIHLRPDGGECIFDCHRGADPEQGLCHEFYLPCWESPLMRLCASLPGRKLDESPPQYCWVLLCGHITR